MNDEFGRAEEESRRKSKESLSGKQTPRGESSELFSRDCILSGQFLEFSRLMSNLSERRTPTDLTSTIYTARDYVSPIDLGTDRAWPLKCDQGKYSRLSSLL